MDLPTGKNAKLKTAIGLGVLLALIANGIYNIATFKRGDPCEERIALYYKEAAGVVVKVDSSLPGRGVWVFVKNQELKEEYDYAGYEIVRKADVGDSIYKPSKSYYGWLFKSNGTKRWVKLRNEWSECDTISPERIQKILQIKDYFKRE